MLTPLLRSAAALQLKAKTAVERETPCCCSGRHLLSFGQIGTEENCRHVRLKTVRFNTHSLRSGFDAGLYGKRIVSEYAMIRPESMPCAEITSYKPTSRY